jgi:hypothetical protein
MTYEQKQMFESLLLWGVIGLLYLLRNTNPLFRGIWNVLRMFFIVLLATLAANYAKDKVKEWWSK